MSFISDDYVSPKLKRVKTVWTAFEYALFFGIDEKVGAAEVDQRLLCVLLYLACYFCLCRVFGKSLFSPLPIQTHTVVVNRALFHLILENMGPINR